MLRRPRTGAFPNDAPTPPVRTFGPLVVDVAHELRTPVTTLEGYLEGLLDGVVQPSGETWTRMGSTFTFSLPLHQ